MVLNWHYSPSVLRNVQSSFNCHRCWEHYWTAVCGAELQWRIAPPQIPIDPVLRNTRLNEITVMTIKLPKHFRAIKAPWSCDFSHLLGSWPKYQTHSLTESTNLSCLQFQEYVLFSCFLVFLLCVWFVFDFPPKNFSSNKNGLLTFIHKQIFYSTFEIEGNCHFLSKCFTHPFLVQ